MSGSAISGRKLESGNCFLLSDCHASHDLCVQGLAGTSVQTGAWGGVAAVAFFGDKPQGEEEYSDISTSLPSLAINESSSHEGLKDQIYLAAKNQPM